MTLSTTTPLNSLTRVNSSEDALHRMRGGMTRRPRFPRVIAVRAKVKIVARQTLIALAREAALPTRITANTCTQRTVLLNPVHGDYNQHVIGLVWWSLGSVTLFIG